MGGARMCGDRGWEPGGGPCVVERGWEFSLDFGRDEVDLLAVLVRHDRIVSGPRIRAQDDPVLGRGKEAVGSVPAASPPAPRLSQPPSPSPRLTWNTRPAMVVPVLRA